MTARTPTGLGGDAKQRLIQQALARRRHVAGEGEQGATLEQVQQAALKVPEAHYRFDQHPGYQQLRVIQQSAMQLGVSNPFFRMHQGTAGAQTQIGEREFLNFASYNYLG
ncbi:MAG: 8-amino-7-oxononanoate synthase, partial [Pseudomonas alloputida]